MENLPHELITLIGAFLRPKNRARLYLCCKYWCRECLGDSQIDHYKKYIDVVNQLNMIKYRIYQQSNGAGELISTRKVCRNNTLDYVYSFARKSDNLNLLVGKRRILIEYHKRNINSANNIEFRITSIDMYSNWRYFCEGTIPVSHEFKCLC
jgi:hypothetical protein